MAGRTHPWIALIALALTAGWGSHARALPIVSTIMDFQNFADNVYGESAWTSFSHTEGDLTLTATAGSTRGSNDYYAYLDHVLSGERAGLGACKAVTDPNLIDQPQANGGGTNRCLDGSDDNITDGEWVRLVFNQEVTLTSLRFVDGTHNLTWAPDAEFSFWVDGVLYGGQNQRFNDVAAVIPGYTDAAVWDLSGKPGGGVTGITFDFGYAGPATDDGTILPADGYTLDDYRFYISGSLTDHVPVPAPTPLLLTLLPLGVLAWQRRKHH